MLYSTPYIPTLTSQPMKRVSAPGAPPSQSTGSRLTASKYSSILAQLCPSSASLDSHDHSLRIVKLTRLRLPCSHHDGLQVHLQTGMISASKCIPDLARSRPPNASSNLLDHSLQVYFQSRMITATTLCQSQPQVCISYNEMISIYPGVFQIYTACR